MKLSPVVLEGPTLRLEPFSAAVLPALTEAALSDREIWKHIPFVVETPAHVAGLVDLAGAMAADGKAVSFATRLRGGGELVGSTTIFLVAPAVPSVEIGATWIVPRWQRTQVNTEAKRLMLAHCFETLGCARVELKTDARNLRSRAAIRRIGASEEGTLRSHMRRADGSLRDSVLFSIVAAEWPAVRARLDAMLARNEARAS
jgi:RimJ/RimL family protein N-acetyltransferase